MKANELLERAADRKASALERDREIYRKQREEEHPWGTAEWLLYDFFEMDEVSLKYTFWFLLTGLGLLVGASIIRVLIGIFT